MNRKMLVMLLGAISLISGSLIFAEEAKSDKQQQQPEVKYQTTCPVMGGKVNKKLFVDAKSKRIYVCCPGCIDKIKKNPEKYIEKLEKEGITLEAICPVMGGKVNKKLFVDVKGKRIYVCCPGCIDVIKKNPEKYIEKLEKYGVTLETVEAGDAKGAKRK